MQASCVVVKLELRYVQRPLYIYTHIPSIYIYIDLAARCTTRLARSRSPITCAAHTVIPIQRQHAHKYPYTLAIYEGRCVSLQKAQRKRRHDYPDAEVARRDRAAQSSQPMKNCRGSETAIKLQPIVQLAYIFLYIYIY